MDVLVENAKRKDGWQSFMLKEPHFSSDVSLFMFFFFVRKLYGLVCCSSWNVDAQIKSW